MNFDGKSVMLWASNNRIIQNVTDEMLSSWVIGLIIGGGIFYPVSMTWLKNSLHASLTNVNRSSRRLEALAEISKLSLQCHSDDRVTNPLKCPYPQNYTECS
jgi:hypothetical protein